MSYTIELAGRTALITGAGQSVGREIAHSMAAAGARVVVNDFVADRAEAVAKEIADAGGSASAAPFDVTDYPGVTAAVREHGPIDVLVNNAGNAGTAGFGFKMFHEEEPADWDRYFGVNLFGVMHCTRAVLPGMIEQGNGGRVITIVSDAGRAGEPRLAAYSAAKGGAAAFSRGLAREVGRHFITVNNIALGTIDPTGSTLGEMAPEVADAMKQRLKPYIIRRLGHPSDVAGLATFLASEQAAWITGQTYPVNGGYTVNQ